MDISINQERACRKFTGGAEIEKKNFSQKNEKAYSHGFGSRNVCFTGGLWK